MDESTSSSSSIYTTLIVPLINKGYDNAGIARELGTSEAHVQDIIDEAVGSEGEEIYRLLLETWDTYIEFPDAWRPKVLAIYQFQSYFYRILPAVFYVGMTGPVGSAKTACLEILRDTCADGVMTLNASVAAVARRLHEGCTMLLDEADEMDSEKRELVYAAARGGYRPGNIYLRYDYKTKGYEEINIYGPKAFSFIKDIEPALASRTFEIPTMRVKDDPFGKVLGNLARGVTRLEDVRQRVESYCLKRARLFNKEEVLTTLQSEDFRKEVESAIGANPSPRDIERTAIALLVSKIAGFDLGTTVKDATQAQATLQDEIVSEFVNYVKQNVGGLEVGAYVKLQSLREGMNASRKQTGDKPVHHKQFRAYLREIGMREGLELKRLPGEGNHILVVTEHCKKMLNIDGSQNPSQVGVGWFTEALNPSQVREASLDSVKNQRERVNKLRELCKALSEGEDACFTLSDLVQKATPFGIPENDVERFIGHEKQDGGLTEPILGMYRVV